MFDTVAVYCYQCHRVYLVTTIYPIYKARAIFHIDSSNRIGLIYSHYFILYINRKIRNKYLVRQKYIVVYTQSGYLKLVSTNLCLTLSKYACGFHQKFTGISPCAAANICIVVSIDPIVEIIIRCIHREPNLQCFAYWKQYTDTLWRAIRSRNIGQIFIRNRIGPLVTAVWG